MKLVSIAEAQLILYKNPVRRSEKERGTGLKSCPVKVVY